MKTYQAETHCHTREVSPCSRIPAEYLIKRYAELGYRYVFITDHYHPVPLEAPWTKNKTWDELVDHYLSGYRAAKKAAVGTDVQVLPGMEAGLATDPDSGLATDFLVYGFDEAFLRKHPRFYRLPYDEFYAMMHAEGFLVFQAHPYRYGGDPVQPICYDGIEIVNTHPRHFSRNQLAVKYAIDHQLYMIGGSDAHSEEDIGRGGVMLPDGIETPMDFVEFYRKNGSPELIVTFGA